MKAKQTALVVLGVWTVCAVWAAHSLKAHAIKITIGDDADADEQPAVAEDDASDDASLHAVWSRRDEAYAVGESGAIFHSEDGGRVWVRQETGVDDDLHAVWGARSGAVWAVGEGGRILKQVAAGVWQPQTSGVEADLNAVWGDDANNLWAAGDEGVVLHSSDGGNRWRRVDSGTDEDLRAISGAAGGVYVAGENGALKKLQAPHAAVSTTGGAPSPQG